MIKATARINNKLGLHARASAKLTKLAGSFRSEVFLSRNGRRVNAKSIMGVMMLAAGIGSEIEIETDGDDEARRWPRCVALIDDKFGEGAVAPHGGGRRRGAAAGMRAARIDS